MNNIINKVLLAGDKFMPEMHLRQPQFTYSACASFTKHKQRIQKFKETGYTNYIYKNELDKACLLMILHKPIIRKFEKRKVHAAFKDNIWGADLADMQLLNKCNKGIRFLLCAIDIFSKCAWVVPLKDLKGVSIIAAFQRILKQSNRKPNKIWVDRGSEFYNASFKKWL